MNSTIRPASLGLLLGASACLMQTLQAQTAPKLSIHMQTGYAGITVTGMVSATHTIEATTNLALTNGWVVLTNVLLPASPWVYIDYASPGMARRFYRASAMITNAPPGITSAPTGVTATTGNGQVTISWNAVSGATSYNIYWSTTSGVTKTNGNKITNILKSTYTHTGRTNGTPYYYVVAAESFWGVSGASVQVSGTPSSN